MSELKLNQVGWQIPRAGSARRPGPLSWAAFMFALLLAIPVGSVLLHLVLPDQGTSARLLATVLPEYLQNTLWLVLWVGAGVTVLGVGAAWLVTMCRFPGRSIFEWALILPLAVPAYVMAYAYTDLLQFAGPVQSWLREVAGFGPRDYWFPQIRSLGGAATMLVLVLYPYVYLLTRAAFLEQSVCVLEASRTLGCTPMAGFRRVALPLARPAIVAGVGLALMETVADFGTVSYFAVPTFTTGIYRAWFSMGDRVAAARLAAGLLGFVLLLLLLERWSRGAARFHHTSRRYRRLPGYELRGLRAAGAVLFCLVPILGGFLLPAAILLRLAAADGDAMLGQRYATLVFNSVTLAGVTALFAVLLALLLSYGARLHPGRLAGVTHRLAGLGYAIPGVVIAVGVLIPVAALDNAVDAWLRASFGFSSGLLLTGSIAALVYAYLVRFLAVSLHTVEASLGKITPNMDQAARSLGRGPLGTLGAVHAPIMWSSVLTAGLVVFVDVMKELPATLIMRPFNFDTLAVQAFNLASDERLSEAATSALAIVAVGLLPVILISRVIGHARPGEAPLPEL